MRVWKILHQRPASRASTVEDDLRRAIEHYEHDMAVSRDVGDLGGVLRAMGHLGDAYAARGEPRRAIEYYEQALAMGRRFGYRKVEVAALASLGNAYVVLGDQLRAMECYEQALAVLRVSEPSTTRHVERLEHRSG